MITCLICDNDFEPSCDIERACKCHDKCLNHLQDMIVLVRQARPEDRERAQEPVRVLRLAR